MSNQLQISGAAKIRNIQGPVVANSGVISALDGDASQYVRGDGTLADFPTSTGGGSSVSYYLNTSVSQGTIGGVAYKQLSKVPISGAGTDVTISANGYIASYLTDANDPALLEVPAGNFNCEFYFSVNSNAHNPYVYAEVYKYDGTTFTLLGSSQSVPEYLTNGTTLSPYYFAIPVATSVLTITDRIAIRIFVNVDGRTVTLHTENNHLCQVVTTFSKGLTTLNSLTRQVQFFQTGTSGSDFNISSVTATHTFNIPDASASARGLITTGTQTIGGAKTFTDVNTFNNGLSLKGGFYPVPTAGDTGLAGSGSGLSIISKVGSTVYTNNLDFGNSSNSYAFPNASGTIALTSNLSSYVPYTGATANVDLGTFSITGGIGTFTNGVLNGNGSNPANLYLKKGVSPFFTNAANYGLIAAVSSSFILISDVDGTNYKYASFNLGSLTNNTNRAYTLPDASGTVALTSDLSSYVTLTTTQTISGAKTFTSTFGTQFDYGIYSPLTSKFDQGIIFLKGTVPTIFSTITTNLYTESTSNNLVIQDQNSKAKLLFDNSTQTYTFPASSGTIALTSSLSSYVPYTGATASVDLGIYNLTASGVNSLGFTARGSGTNSGYIIIKQGTTYLGNVVGYNSINANSTKYVLISDADGTNYKSASFQLGSLTNNTERTYTLPDASGTLALTSDLGGYLPLTGGIMTGSILLNNNLAISGQLFGTSSYASMISMSPSNKIVIDSNSQGVLFGGTIGQGAYTYTLPSATGTLALGTGTTNYVSKWTGTNTIGNSLIFDNGTNVGIGNTNTSYTLDVSGTLRNTTSAYFATTSGNVGIGTLSPSSWATSLVVYNNQLTITGGGYDGSFADSIFFGGNSEGTNYRNKISNSLSSNVVNQKMKFSIASGATTFVDVMTLVGNGNVGIGTSSPASLLHLQSSASGGQNFRMQTSIAAGRNYMQFANGSGDMGYFGYGGPDNKFYIINQKNDDMLFYTNDAERMRILANGQMNPGADNSYGFGGSGIRWAVIWAANGTIQTSDKREKKDIKESDLGLNFISKLNPVSFKWIVGHNEVSTKKVIDVDGSEKNEQVITPREGKRKHYGLIAQEVKEALNGVDFGGFIEDEETGIMGLRYDQFVPILIKAMQEQNQIIQELNERLNKAGL